MVQINVTGGVIEGEKIENDFCGSYYSFKGIPYAEPPVGDLRFQAPKPIKPWNGIRYTKYFGPRCPQVDFLFKAHNLPYSEDCLYLNVYSPNVAPKKLLPVMVWIHGGGFICGSGNDNFYGPEYLMKREIVLITFNYRIGAIGFLCLDTEAIPGNAGFKDQVAVLHWVKHNIGHFGGDPNNVTIFGESAGSVSVSAHLVSPMSKGLFKRAILQSGVQNNCWGEVTEARNKAFKFAEHFGCYSNDDTIVADLFKSLPVESLVFSTFPKLTTTFIEGEKEYIEIVFGLVNEKKFKNIEYFYSGDSYDNIRNNIHDGVDVMIGYNEGEGFLVSGLTNVNNAITHANTYYEYFVPKSILHNSTPLISCEIGKRIKQFYINQLPICKSNILQLINFYSAAFIYYDIINWCRLVASTKKRQIFFYKFTCISDRNIFSSVFGNDNLYEYKNVACHADEIAYLFTNNIRNSQSKMGPKEKLMIENVTKLWTNFAKFGNPTPDASLGVMWPKYNLEDQCYLNIGEKLIVEKRPNDEDVKFWDNIFKKYHTTNFVENYYC